MATVNVSVKIICKNCNSEIENPYSKEELLSGKFLKFTCENCGYSFEKNTASEIRAEAVRAAKEAFRKQGLNVK